LTLRIVWLSMLMIIVNFWSNDCRPTGCAKIVWMVKSDRGGRSPPLTRSKLRETAWSKSRTVSGLKGWAPDRMVVIEGVPINLTLQLIRRESWSVI
jgi:hypothetical protein